jgi:sulfur relay (sulfurtransferase) complex TusBCD TusD component (DsrE family)
MLRMAGLLLVVLIISGLGYAEESRATSLFFVHEQYDTPQLAELRSQYDFDEALEAGLSELEQIFLLKDWVFNAIDFRVNFAMAELRNSLQILELSQEKGVNFHCSQMAAVYMQTAVAMGWTARYLFMRNTAAEEHATNEIWSNELAKWVFIDATWNLHLEKDGVPLSALEIRREWLRNSAKDLDYVYGAGDTEVRYTYRDFPIKRSDNRAWLLWPIDELFVAYTYEMAYVTRNDFFSHGDGSGGHVWDHLVILKDEVNANDTSWAFRGRPSATNMQELYPAINRVDVYSDKLGAGMVALRFDVFGRYSDTPNFQDFLIQIGSRPWRAQKGAGFVLVGAERYERVRVRVRNKFGVLGPITTYLAGS